MIKINDKVKVNSPDMIGEWEVISVYNDSYGIKTAIVRGSGVIVKTDYKSLISTNLKRKIT